jgi:hypothetical protein
LGLCGDSTIFFSGGACLVLRQAQDDGDFLTEAAQFVAEGRGEGAGAVAFELRVDGFEAADEVDDFGAGAGSAGGGAEMGAAAKGAVVVDEAATVGAEERAGAVGMFRERFAAGGAEGARGEERFAAGDLRDAAGGLELAAASEAGAGAVDWAGFEFLVDGADFGESEGFARAR